MYQSMLQSCDTMVAPGSATIAGSTLFAKNSDRPADECQPLVRHPRQSHPEGAVAGRQFVSVPQVSTTFSHVGSRPYWCWGYEHGFNEHQVAIGNEAVHSRLDSAPEPKLRSVKLANLRAELPGDTPRISAAARAEILKRRRRAVWRRYRR